jgi:hypothetical protein
MSTFSRCFALLLFVTAFGIAQDRGTIRGAVTDQSNAAVPDAVVTVRNIDTGLVQTVRTGGDGVFNVLYLPVGNYTVSTEKSGFRKAESTGVRVNVNTVVEVDVKLTVGAVAEAVEVTAASPLLETQGSNLGKVVPTKAIMDLPLFISGGLRSNMSFIILTPGVIGSSANPRIGGGLLSGQSEQLDGAEANSERRNDAAFNGLSVEAVEEFKVQSGAYSAEYGRTSNGVINFVSKSGTNQLHGSAFVFNRNEFFNARGFTFTPTTRPVVRQWNPGGSVGGPVYIPKVYDGRNKAFFFVAFERASTRNGQSTSLTTVPIDEFRIGDMRKFVNTAGKQIPLYDPFDANGDIIADPFARPLLQCNGVVNVICPNRIDPIAKANIALLPEPDDPTKLTNNTRSAASSTSKSWVVSTKGDYLFSEKHRVSFLWSRYFNPATPRLGAVKGVPDSNWNTTQNIRYYRFNDDYIFRPNLLNHLTLGFNRRNLIENPGNTNGIDPAYAKAVQIPGTTTQLKEGKSTRYDTSYITFGTHVDTDSRQRTISIKEQVAWLKGRHSVKYGFDYVKVLYRRLDCNDCPGHMLFSNVATSNPGVSGTTGSDWASFLLGLSSYGQMGYSGDFTYSAPYYAWYVQDDFKVNHKLTLNIGLRYDLPIPKTERHLHNSNFCPTCPNPAAGGIPGAMAFAGIGNAKDVTHWGETRKNAWGPRLGFAYQLTPKTVIRAGSSIYYQPTREDGNADRGTQGFGGWFFSPTDYLGTGIALQLKNGFNQFGNLVQFNKPPVTDPSISIYSNPFYFFPKAGRAPYFMDWQFTIEQSVTRTSVARVSYHGTVGNKLLSRIDSINQMDPKYFSIYGALLGQPLSAVLNNPVVVASGFKLPWPSYPLTRQLQQALRPYPQYDQIDSTAGGLNNGHMTFHAFEASFEHRFEHGLYMIASYTFAKILSNSSDEGGTSQPAQNQYNLRAEKAVAAADTPHNLRVSYVYELPIGKGQKLLSRMHPVADAILGNWKVSAIHTYVSGTAMGPFGCSQNVFGASGTTPSVGSNNTAQALGTRCSFAVGAGTTIPLVNPAWSSDNSVAFSVPYLNAAAFRVPGTFEYGNMPLRLDYLRGPWTINEDLSILKNFTAGEKRHVEFRASASNALNRHLLPAPNTSIAGNTFGFITAPQGNSPRNIQLGLKLYF